MNKQLKIPKFRSEKQERKFWSKIDLSKYFKKQDFKSMAFSNLKPSSRPISIRMPEYLLARLKQKANALRISYQTLIKQYVAKGILQTG